MFYKKNKLKNHKLHEKKKKDQIKNIANNFFFKI